MKVKYEVTYNKYRNYVNILELDTGIATTFPIKVLKENDTFEIAKGWKKEVPIKNNLGSTLNILIFARERCIEKGL